MGKRTRARDAARHHGVLHRGYGCAAATHAEAHRLKGFGKAQTAEVLIQSLVNLSAEISHGFDGVELVLKQGGATHGLMMEAGKAVTIKSTGGVPQKVPKAKIKEAKLRRRSRMLGSDEGGLTAQNTADIVEWLEGY